MRAEMFFNRPCVLPTSAEYDEKRHDLQFTYVENGNVRCARAGKKSMDGLTELSTQHPLGLYFDSINTYLYGRCKIVKYCSPKCQKQDWPNHKAVCRPPLAKT